jgi:hypothetical protein
MPFADFYDLITLANNHFIIAADKAVWAGTANTNPGAMTISDLGSVSTTFQYLSSVCCHRPRLVCVRDVNLVASRSTTLIRMLLSGTTSA